MIKEFFAKLIGFGESNEKRESTIEQFQKENQREAEMALERKAMIQAQQKKESSSEPEKEVNLNDELDAISKKDDKAA